MREITRKTVFRRIAAVLVLLIVAGGLGLWWIMQQPMYRPPGLAQMDIKDPIGASADLTDADSRVSRGRWEVEPGVELSHFSVGEGTNILVVHGGPGIPQTASAPAFDVLGDAYRLHYYAQRGTGESFRPTFDFSGSRWASIQALEGTLGIGQQLADIERIRRLLGDQRLILVGHSYGALLAALYAAEMPDRVMALLLIAPADLVVFPSLHGGLFDNLRDRLAEAERTAYDAWLEEYLDLGEIFTETEAELAGRDSELIHFFEAAGWEAPAAVSPPPSQVGAWHARAQYFSMGLRHDYSDALGRITAPTLVVHGGDDLQPIEVAEDYCRWIADSEIVTIPGAGHFPHYTHGEALAPVVRAFLDGLTDGKGRPVGLMSNPARER
ncbi:MAG: alpha/beta hydrolase [Bryobacterales bacterium]|nr:alpha/beta hydrolase [Bryobacterales bacterium]